MAMGAVSNGGKRRRGDHTHMGWLCYVFLAFLCFFCNIGRSTDSLRPGELVTRNRTLVSAGGDFALGFFRPGNSSSSFLGIWYNTINNTVIWVANRESPLPQDSEAFFTMGYDGNLQLLDGGRNIIWSTNISGGGGGSTAAQLQDTGDLVVKQGESIVWESFDGDSDTLMPGMRLKVNKKTGKRNLIRSWTGSDDPRGGKFSWGMDPKGSPQMFIWKENIPHFRSTLYQDGFPYSVYFPSAGYTSYSFATENDEVYFSYGYANTSIQARFILTPEGYIHILSRPKTSEIWQIQWVAPRLDCELYARCGSFGTCERIDSHPVCSCLEGFKPKSQRDWDKGKYDAGCERGIALGCGEDDTFMRLPMMKWPDHSSSLGNMTFKECEMECSKTCSCTAFAYATTSNSAVNCINWLGDLVDLARNYSPGGFSQDLYVRVHSSELNGSSGNDNSSHNSKRRLVAIIVASVSAFFLITVLVYILTYGRKGWVCRKVTVSTASLLGKDDIEPISLRKVWFPNAERMPTVVEGSVSRTLGSKDSATNSFSTRRERGLGTGNRVWKRKQLQHISSDPLMNLRSLVGEECSLPDFGRVEGDVNLEEEDILILEETFRFRLLGSFAGRFPGMKAIEELIKSWGVKCKAEASSNSHVIFYFLKEEERQNVLKGGPYGLYGKRLFLHSLPNDVSLGFEECRKLPIWIRMPWLPKACWHVNALSKIAGKFGKPLYRDRVTMEMKKTAFARILVEMDCSIYQPDHVTIKLPGGKSFDQSVVFEGLSFFCTRCGCAKHITEDCSLNREVVKQRLATNVVAEPTASVGAESSPVVNENGISPEAHEDHASPPEEESFLQDNGKSPEVPDVTHPKEKSSGLDKGACSSDDDNDSSFDDSLKYKIWSRGLEMALEDGVFGTLSNNPSASSSGNANPKLKKNKKNKPHGNKMVIGGAGKQLKR